jgi:hypothetical protein
MIDFAKTHNGLGYPIVAGRDAAVVRSDAYCASIRKSTCSG